MAIKKRTTLRSKSSKKISSGTSVEQKKEKILDKLAERSEKIDNDSTQTHIIKSNSSINKPIKTENLSKSTIRRRKRKLRDQLRPKLTEDLLTALTDSTNSKIEVDDKGTEQIIVGETVRLDHTPNPLNKRGEMALFKIENENFKNVLKDKTLNLRKNGLSSLKDSILMNLSRDS